MTTVSRIFPTTMKIPATNSPHPATDRRARTIRTQPTKSPMYPTKITKIPTRNPTSPMKNPTSRQSPGIRAAQLSLRIRTRCNTCLPLPPAARAKEIFNIGYVRTAANTLPTAPPCMR